MKINPASQTALTGIRKGLHDMQSNAAKVASAETASGEGLPAEALVNVKQAAHHIEANVDVVRAESDMLGTLLDVKA